MMKKVSTSRDMSNPEEKDQTNIWRKLSYSIKNEKIIAQKSQNRWNVNNRKQKQHEVNGLLETFLKKVYTEISCDENLEEDSFESQIIENIEITNIIPAFPQDELLQSEYSFNLKGRHQELEDQHIFVKQVTDKKFRQESDRTQNKLQEVMNDNTALKKQNQALVQTIHELEKRSKNLSEQNRELKRNLKSLLQSSLSIKKQFDQLLEQIRVQIGLEQEKLRYSYQKKFSQFVNQVNEALRPQQKISFMRDWSVHIHQINQNFSTKQSMIKGDRQRKKSDTLANSIWVSSQSKKSDGQVSEDKWKRTQTFYSQIGSLKKT